MQSSVKPTISFLVQNHRELEKKKSSKEVYRTESIKIQESNPLSLYPQISQILDQTSF